RFEFELENELRQELEEEDPAWLELEGGRESDPLLELGSEDEWEQLPVRCPTPRRETVSGFSRYSNSVASLPPSEQTKVKNLANMILKSFQPGCQPILTVRRVGHADRDLGRERREPGFMMKISRERALAVRRTVERIINNRAISSRIGWVVAGAGASQLAVPN